MKRIDPASVPDVFERHNLKPVTGAFVGSVEDHECCVLSALYCDSKGCVMPEECLLEVKREVYGQQELVAGEFDDSYAEGVMEGWDDGDNIEVVAVEPTENGLYHHLVLPNGERLLRRPGWIEGLRDGAAARKAVEHRLGGTLPSVAEDKYDCPDCGESECICDSEFDDFDIMDEMIDADEDDCEEEPHWERDM